MVGAGNGCGWEDETTDGSCGVAYDGSIIPGRCCGGVQFGTCGVVREGSITAAHECTCNGGLRPNPVTGRCDFTCEPICSSSSSSCGLCDDSEPSTQGSIMNTPGDPWCVVSSLTETYEQGVGCICDTNGLGSGSGGSSVEPETIGPWCSHSKRVTLDCSTLDRSVPNQLIQCVTNDQTFGWNTNVNSPAPSTAANAYTYTCTASGGSYNLIDGSGTNNINSTIDRFDVTVSDIKLYEDPLSTGGGPFQAPLATSLEERCEAVFTKMAADGTSETFCPSPLMLKSRGEGSASNPHSSGCISPNLHDPAVGLLAHMYNGDNVFCLTTTCPSLDPSDCADDSSNYIYECRNGGGSGHLLGNAPQILLQECYMHVSKSDVGPNTVPSVETVARAMVQCCASTVIRGVSRAPPDPFKCGP